MKPVKILIFFIMLIVFFYFKVTSYAIYDPLSKPNNFFGIHILFPDEIEDASKLVNSNGGEWGYVTVPIQAGERDLEKWQTFFNRCSQLKLIPIVRLVTEKTINDSSYWRMPNEYDLVDFANFLDSLSWPSKNRYILLFNEINRYDEWGGEYPNPSYYADLIVSANEIFKSRSDDFFLIMGAFDNASVTDGKKYVNGFHYLNLMFQYNPEVFNKIDGFASHSYPNPAFSQPPNAFSRIGIATYKYEYEYINERAENKKYVFITETGWDIDKVGEENVASYYTKAFSSIWEEDKDKIVAITPFLIKSENGQFDVFSFFKNGVPRSNYKAVYTLPKTKGNPLVEPYRIEELDKLKLRKVADEATSSAAFENLHRNRFIKNYLKIVLQLPL